MNDPSQKDFAERVLAGLRERGAEHFDFDETSFSITCPAGQHFLGFLYSESQALSESQRSLVVERAVETTLQLRDANEPTSADANRLMPVLASRTFYVHIVPHQLAKQAGCDDDDPNVELDHAVIGDHLAVGLAIDHDTRIQYVAETSSLGLDFQSASERAVANLRRSRRGLSLHSPGVYVASNDDYDAAYFLLVDAVRALPLLGDPVAVAPCRGFFLVTGSDDVMGLAVLAREVRSRIQGARPITSFTFRLRKDDTWEVWTPPGGDAGSLLLRECARREMAQLYNEQRARFDVIVENGEDDEGLFYSSVMEIVGAEFRTLSTWTSGVRTLLPETDYVAINGDSLIMVAWERFRAVCGSDLRRRADLYPARWETMACPTSAQLALLQRFQTSLPRDQPRPAPAPAQQDRRATQRKRSAQVRRPLIDDIAPRRRETPFVVWILLACAILVALYAAFAR